MSSYDESLSQAESIEIVQRASTRLVVGRRAVNYLRTVILACVAMGDPRPAAAQVDQQRAQQYFKEAQAICERDGGRMWGVSLCGPMVIADLKGTIATNQPAPAGARPSGIGFLNAPVQWSGTTWAAYSWPMLIHDNQVARGRMLMHELFHGLVQPPLGLRRSGPEDIHLASLEGRYWMRLEMRALASALRSSGAARTSAIADVLAFRAARHRRFPDAEAAEQAIDMNEGVATYAGYALASQNLQDDIRDAIATMTAAEVAEESFVRTYAYATGGPYGLLLDALSPGWHRQITATSDLGRLLAAAAGVTALPDATSAALRYDGPQIRANEEQRERAQQAAIDAQRGRFVDGPVLIVPRAGGGSVNNMGAIVISGVGTVFPAMSNKGAWGFFNATAGAMVAADGQTISLPAPVVVDATTMRGDGWTATVGPGWIVRDGPRRGDYSVVRQDDVPK